MFKLVDLYQAYKKAKAEAFYESSHFHAHAFVEYERELGKNLNRLKIELNKQNPTWGKNLKKFGGHIYCPKGIDNEKSKSDEDSPSHFSTSDAVKDWVQKYEVGGNTPFDVSFRLIIQPTVNAQIISALWIIRVGHKYDAKVNAAYSYGNRLRRIGRDRKLNLDANGLFSPYFSAYKAWRERGLAVMRESLKENKKIVAITMDAKNFYHNINPEFILDTSFIEKTDIHLSGNEYHFTKILLEAIKEWHSNAPAYETTMKSSLPVGLSASKIISNVILKEFDDNIVRELRPLYYGRYVDDVFMVFEAPVEFSSAQDVTKWIVSRLPSLLSIDGKDIKVNLAYARDSEIIFTSKKQRVFLLDGQSGLDLIKNISEQIRVQSSEHRLLPELPESSTEMVAQALLATPNASLVADALRKADVVSIRRLGFSLLLRDVECYARDLKPKDWELTRKKFYGIVRRHVVTPTGFFELFSYCHRVFGLMIACRDFKDANEFITSFLSVVRVLKETSTSGTTKLEQFELCLRYYANAFRQVAIQASTVAGFRFSISYLSCLKELKLLSANLRVPKTREKAQEITKQFLLSDWGRRSYREYWLGSIRRDLGAPLVPKQLDIKRVLRLGAIRNFRRAAELPEPWWPALAFPTRPLSIAEITLVAPRLMRHEILLEQAIFALRGARVSRYSSGGLGIVREDNEPHHIFIPSKPSEKTIATLTSLETTDLQWELSVKNTPDHSYARYKRFKSLVNKILRDEVRPAYIVMPECSVPLKWAFSAAQKLAQNGVSFICGLEYTHTKQGISNEAFLSLTTNWPGYRAPIWVKQTKMCGSYNELKSIKTLNGPPLLTAMDADSARAVYVHGGFCFGVLLCSDLTSLENRLHYQGFIDALFVLEWNPDVQTFSTLIESAAHDLHAYIIQVNNRRFGDSRIRAPRKLEYERDVVRLKGGTNDFFVSAEVDFRSLRKYQNAKRPSEKGPFKPWPIGYKKSTTRI